MELGSAPILSTAVLGLLLLLLLWNIKRQLRLPPGPRGLPIFGSLFKMRGMLRTPMILQNLAQEHGPIFTLHLGSIPLILISSPAIVHEALIEKGGLFSSRPRSTIRRQLMLSNNHRSINSAAYGTHWRTVRRNLVSHVLSPVQVNAFQTARYRAVRRLVERIRADRRAVFPVLPAVRFTVFSVLSYMCFGYWLEDEGVRRLEALLREVITSARGSLGDFVPLLRIFRLPNSKDEMLETVKSKRDGVLVPLIRNSQKLAETGDLDPSSYFSSLLALQSELELTDADYVVLCSEFLNAGADTTANTMEWTLACMIKYPDVQRKVYQEITSQVNGGAEVTEQDVEKLVYLQAAVKETLRMHPPGYTTLPHAVTQPCKLAGYDIPTNASLLFNIYAVNNDPGLWESPGEFRPERFIGEGGVHADYTASSGQLNLIPFGAGRRICPGLGLATLHIHYILARLVQEFEWSSGEEDGMVDLTAKQDFTVVMKNPLRATVKVRT